MGACVSSETRVKRATNLLKNPDVRAAIADVFELEADFSVADALQMHVRHIRGGVEREVLGADGEIAMVRLPPSYQALKDYERMVLPEMPKRTEVDIRKMSVTGRMDGPAGPPRMSARIIGEGSE